jgi:hypothetical protein
VLPTVARFEAMQKANQAFADQIKHSLASLDEFNRAFAGLETFSRIAEQQARLFQNGVASAISRTIESASKFPNRHGVLHGFDLTYPSRRNSFKAIAWLQYVAGFAFLDRK